MTRDLAPYRLVVGNPAVPAGRVRECGRHLGAGYRCPGGGRANELVSDSDGLRRRPDLDDPCGVTDASPRPDRDPPTGHRDADGR